MGKKYKIDKDPYIYVTLYPYCVYVKRLCLYWKRLNSFKTYNEATEFIKYLQELPKLPQYFIDETN